MTLRFSGHIAGIDTRSGTRIVVGSWRQSPFGRFADVMVERPDGHRILLAPTRQVADFVAGTYTFDEVRIEPVTVTAGATWTVATASLSSTFVPGRRLAISYALRVVTPPLRRSRTWARLCNPLASRLMPGVSTYGTAGNGRTEWYAARDTRRLETATVSWEGADLGGLADVAPPVRFGFGSSPATPSLTEVTSYIDVGIR